MTPLVKQLVSSLDYNKKLKIYLHGLPSSIKYNEVTEIVIALITYSSSSNNY